MWAWNGLALTRNFCKNANPLRIQLEAFEPKRMSDRITMEWTSDMQHFTKLKTHRNGWRSFFRAQLHQYLMELTISLRQSTSTRSDNDVHRPSSNASCDFWGNHEDSDIFVSACAPPSPCALCLSNARANETTPEHKRQNTRDNFLNAQIHSDCVREIQPVRMAHARFSWV